MHSVVLLFIVTSACVCIKADDGPLVEIYEIRKGNFDAADKAELNIQVDDVNNNNDGLNIIEFELDELRNTDNGDKQIRDRQGHHRQNIGRQNSNRKDRDRQTHDTEIDLVATNLIDKLRKIINSQKYSQNRDIDDDYIASYKALKEDSVFEDSDETPVILLANKNNLYHINPKTSRYVNNNLQSILRSINNGDEIEDRTAPPGKRTHYDYEY